MGVLGRGGGGGANEGVWRGKGSVEREICCGVGVEWSVVGRIVWRGEDMEWWGCGKV